MIGLGWTRTNQHSWKHCWLWIQRRRNHHFPICARRQAGLHAKTGPRYSERLAEAGVEPSVGSKGDSYDALAETISGLYKAELIHRRVLWKTKEFLELATLEWVSWFNHHRLLEPIGYVPPAEAEANYYRHLAEQAPIPA